MKVRLGDLTRIRTGKLDANASSVDGQYPFFTCSKEPLKIATYSYDCECILVAGNGDLNVKYYNGKFDAYQRTYIIEGNDNDRLYIPYLYFFMDKYVEELRKLSIGGVIKYIKLGNLTDAMIELPNIEMQKNIVRLLSKLKDMITCRQRQLQKLDELVKARFVEMFGDMLLNPMALKEQTLDSMADVVSGITKGRKTKDQHLIDVPYMAVSNVKDGYIDWTTIKTISATKQEINQYRLLPDDVLMTEGGDPDKLGRGAIIKAPLENCIHQNHIFRVRLNESLILAIFFAEYLKHQKAKRYFLGCAKQTTGIASINMRQLKALPVLLPPLQLQEQFEIFIEQTEKAKVAVQKALDEAQLLFDSLMQQYFS